MPGDSILIGGITDSLRLHDSLEKLQLAAQPHKTETGGDTGSGFFILLLIIAAVSGFLINRQWKKYQQKLAYKAAETSLRANFLQYDEWLTDCNGYYKSLSAAMRARFLERVARFTATKTIHCIDLPADDKMPLLIGAASVQITFGLDKYLLDFFDTIYVMQHNYRYGLFDKPFEGHVNSNGIYLSWDNFLKGFADYTDADNVGIHEMAHALAYVNFMAEANGGQDEAFISRFYNFSTVARPVFNEMQNGSTNMLNAYAATNYNEFWAVAVETFFEKAIQMKIELPDLYSAICSLLNQDPMLPDKLLSVS